jgi:hypothetical protein
LRAQSADDVLSLLERHAINGFRSDAFGRRASIAVNLAISGQGEISVKQLSIDSRERESVFASFAEKSQVRIGRLHFACLCVYGLLDPLDVAS